MTVNVARPGVFSHVNRTVRWLLGPWTIEAVYRGSRLVRTRAWRQP